MTRIMLVALLALAAPAGAAERRYTITDFDRVEVNGPFVVVLTTGRASSALASGSTAAIEGVSIDVRGKTLRIQPNRSAWGGCPGETAGPIRVVLTTQALRGAALSGSGSLSIDKARSMKFDALVSGSGRMEIGSVEADNLGIGVLGAGKIGIGGKAKGLRATLKGSGDLDAEGLVVEDAEVNADTAGTIGVSVRRAVTVTSTGTGDTTIIGKPACKVKQLGSGQVRCGS